MTETSSSVRKSAVPTRTGAAVPSRLLGALRAVPGFPSAAAWAAAGLALRCGTASAQGLGELGQNVSGNISGIAKAILVGGFCFGVYLVISGLVEFYNSNKKPNCTFGGAAIKCSVGVCLLAAQAIASSFSTTLFGGDKSATGWGTLGF